MSNRALQRKHGVGYRTVVAALESAWPKERKPPSERGSRLDQHRGVINDWLQSDLDAPRKQRHTAKRIFDRLWMSTPPPTCRTGWCASVAIGSNESFSGWTKPFTDPRLCAAVVDRPTFNGTIIETGTDSYRLAHTLAQQAS